jgi:hypothetical protein
MLLIKHGAFQLPDVAGLRVKVCVAYAPSVLHTEGQACGGMTSCESKLWRDSDTSCHLCPDAKGVNEESLRASVVHRPRFADPTRKQHIAQQNDMKA